MRWRRPCCGLIRTRECRRTRVLAAVVLCVLLACQFSGWVLDTTTPGTPVGRPTRLPATLRALHDPVNPNTSSLPHLAGWHRPGSSAAYSWRVERALAGHVTPCHRGPRDYQRHPVRLRDQGGYSMTRLHHDGSGEVEGCAVPCVRVTGMGFRPLAFRVTIFGAALVASGVALHFRVAARVGQATDLKAKDDPRVVRVPKLNPSLRVSRHVSQRRSEQGRQQHAGGATLWFPPAVLFGCVGVYAAKQLLNAWQDRADVSPSSSFALLTEGCGWYWSSTMENRGDTVAQMARLPLHSPTVVSSTMLASDVPVPYSEPQLLEQIYGASRATEIKQSFERRSQSVGLAAAFISNCGPGAPQLERLRWVQGLMDAGVSVDSYGRCLHNREEGRREGSDRNGGAKKIDLLRQYKFAIAFENSPLTDYTTEKFTQALIAGAIPITLGPPNIRDFAPHPDSFMAAESFGSPTQLAQAVLTIADNRQRWEHMAANWRDVPLLLRSDPQEWLLEDDPTVLYRQFASSVSLNSVHSDCRRCIWVADAYRLRHGLGALDQTDRQAAPLLDDPRQQMPLYAVQDEYVGEVGTHADRANAICDWVAVRERGAYRFVRVKIPQDNSMTSVEQLQHRAVSAMRVYPQATAHGRIEDQAVVAMLYTLWGREVLNSAASVASLACGTELELVLVPPAPL